MVLSGAASAVFSLRVSPDTQPPAGPPPTLSPGHIFPSSPSPALFPARAPPEDAGPGPGAHVDSGATLSLWQVPWLKQSKSPLGPHARSPPGLCNMYQVRRLLLAAPATRRQGRLAPAPGASERQLVSPAGRLLGRRGKGKRRDREEGPREGSGASILGGGALQGRGRGEGREMPAAGLAHPKAACEMAHLL